MVQQDACRQVGRKAVSSFGVDSDDDEFRSSGFKVGTSYWWKSRAACSASAPDNGIRLNPASPPRIPHIIQRLPLPIRHRKRELQRRAAANCFYHYLVVARLQRYVRRG